MKWTQEFPKVDGIYWYVDRIFNEPQLVRIKLGLMSDRFKYLGWFGYAEITTLVKLDALEARFYGPLNICPPNPLNPA